MCIRDRARTLVQKILDNAKFPGAQEIITIDGLRVDYADGFGLLRPSNTTPVLVMRFEGHTPEALHRIESDFMAALRAVKPDAQLAAAAH
jgi:phosphomannomutase